MLRTQSFFTVFFTTYCKIIKQYFLKMDLCIVNNAVNSLWSLPCIIY